MNMNKQWYIKSIPENQNSIELNNYQPVIRNILKKRGLTEKKEIEKFVKPELSDLYDPFRFQEMEIAVDRIIKAIEKEEKIVVYGDYDVDGVTAITVLHNYFREIFNYEIDYYVPERLKEGYGLNREALERIIKNDCDLLITVDCGITASEEISFANSRGLDVIITDHHQPGPDLTAAVAVINPYCKKESYPFQELAGVGVVFKLCQALENKLSGSFISQELIQILDIVTLGTVADIVPLQDENRILVKKGLELIPDTKNVGLKKLLKKTGLTNKTMTAGKIGYILAPPLNAAGRLQNADFGIELLTTRSEKKAENLADDLVKTNRERQKEEDKIFEEAIKMIEKNIDLSLTTGIILGSDSWHPGVVGIVASRIVEKYYRPAILVAFDEEIGRGSARSIKNLNLYQALKTCSDLFETYGGHSQAAGISIKKENFQKFREQINECFSKKLSEKDLIPALKLDSIISPENINKKLVNELKLLKPFGVGNPGPKFLLNNIRVKNSYRVGKENKHLKIKLNNGTSGIAFDFGNYESKIKNKNIDLAFTPEINRWNGNEKVELKICDINIRADNNHFPISFMKKKWRIYDKRNFNYDNALEQDLIYINKLLNSGQKVLVYNNNLSRINKVREISDAKNIYDNRQQNCLQKFQNSSSGIFFFSSNLDLLKQFNPDHLVFMSLPFSLNMFFNIIKKINFKKDKNIHLLFGEKDYYQNKTLIRKRLPAGEELSMFYQILKKSSSPKITFNLIKKALSANDLPANNRFINNALSIFKELNLINKDENQIKVYEKNHKKLDLSDSMSYNKIIKTIEEFNELAQLMFKSDVFNLIKELNENI